MGWRMIFKAADGIRGFLSVWKTADVIRGFGSNVYLHSALHIPQSVGCRCIGLFSLLPWREKVAEGRMSGCDGFQGFFLHAGVIFQGELVLIMVLRMTRSLRMQAVR